MAPSRQGSYGLATTRPLEPKHLDFNNVRKGHASNESKTFMFVNSIWVPPPIPTNHRSSSKNNPKNVRAELIIHHSSGGIFQENARVNQMQPHTRHASSSDSPRKYGRPVLFLFVLTFRFVAHRYTSNKFSYNMI